MCLLFTAIARNPIQSPIRTYGCAYCSSHTAVMGSVWKGAGLSLEKNSLAMDPVPNPDVFSPKELAAINIAKKVSSGGGGGGE